MTTDPVAEVFHNLGARVEDGGMLYSVIKASDFFTSDIERRSPGSEYKVVEGADPEQKLATVEDYGGKFQITSEQISRNDVSYLDQQVTQLSNTIARKLDVVAMAMVVALVIDDNIVTGHNWTNLVTVSPLDDITPSASRLTADLSAAQLASDLQELGIKHGLLIVQTNQAHALRVAYGDNLDDMLKSAGVGLFSNPRVTAGTGTVQSGQHRWIRAPADRRSLGRQSHPIDVGAGLRRTGVCRRQALRRQEDHRPGRLTREDIMTAIEFDNEQGTTLLALLDLPIDTYPADHCHPGSGRGPGQG
ncbi:major capsid protein [Rhodococcus sp. IC4_135]|uniref:major capsid protein n=1 Tax=Rhodococcus sp. IC4_135 TaxID=2715537 RepID=UPI001F104AE2